MPFDDYYQLGYIVKPHGLQGELNVIFDVDFPENYQHLESVFIALPQGGALIPFFIEHLSISDQKTILKLEDIDSLEQAQELLKAQLYLPLSDLPELEEDQFYYHEIIGFTVEDAHQGRLGTIRDVYEANGQDLIAMDYRQEEVLIPLNDAIVVKVDKARKLVFTELPEGLLDVYFS